ncbi:hypothetical protein Nepgr_022673 [Nepenthes gracilis]|uniref:Uncharacterized protein n=1 Tax=Nepenthes gracilis TaxID=150966 RepID=A0AAD3T1A5_NEPGR|nr:hypothetical protein Nepgr_022673 [Nepenthes gracilis]
MFTQHDTIHTKVSKNTSRISHLEGHLEEHVAYIRGVLIFSLCVDVVEWWCLATRFLLRNLTVLWHGVPDKACYCG